MKRSDPKRSSSLLGPSQIGPVLFLAIVLAGACSDASSDPTAVLMAEETRSALLVTSELPSLSELLQRHRVSSSAGAQALNLWTASWDLAGPRGDAFRDRAYELAAPGLARSMSTGEVAGLVRDVDGAVSAAESVGLSQPVPDFVADRLRIARELLEGAYLAMGEGDPSGAIRLGLASADRIQALQPRRVVQRLLDRAEEALRRNGGPDTYTPQELRRADRLIRGARAALDEGDMPRAVRRAFYACQVLGVTVN